MSHSLWPQGDFLGERGGAEQVRPLVICREVGLHAQRAQLMDGMDTDEGNKQIGCKGCRQDHIMAVKGGVWRGYLVE